MIRRTTGTHTVFSVRNTMSEVLSAISRFYGGSDDHHGEVHGDTRRRISASITSATVSPSAVPSITTNRDENSRASVR